jgi:hypothetical protein
MPRKDIDPGTITTGPGKAAPAESDFYLGMVAPGQGYLEGDDSIPDVGGGGTAALKAHIEDPVGAHPASAISVDDAPDLLGTRNVEQSLDALMAGLTVRPLEMGILPRVSSVPLTSSLPGWGVLSLIDSNLVEQGNITVPTTMFGAAENSPEYIYPYYFQPPSPAVDFYSLPIVQIGSENSAYVAGDDQEGSDPHEYQRYGDIWNEPTVLGAGNGYGRAGAFSDGTDVVRTTCMYPRAPGFFVPGCVSGMVYPADRGVLALIWWPYDGDVAAFLAQDLLTRCAAAILLGQGIRGGDCIHWDDSVGAPVMCDGEPGGIFEPGVDEQGAYDPFAYPGRAGGQYNLAEIYSGVSSIDGQPLPDPWDDFDGDGVQGANRKVDSEIPGPAQVRLGTDPAAGVPNVSPYGIPILGAGPAAYENPALLPLVDGFPSLGLSFVPDGVLVPDSNFFSYRLPVLGSYDHDFGLRYTPRGIDPMESKETLRYFVPEEPFLDLDDWVEEYTPGVDRLLAGGAYMPLFGGDEQESGGSDMYWSLFGNDCWLWQVARYRHSFYVPDSKTVGPKGTYWMMHFKTEGDFEKFVRDGTMPWDVAAGYELYGASTAADSIENYGNIVNEDPATELSPRGAAPDYGYGSFSYYNNKTVIFVGDKDNHDDIAVTNAEWGYNVGGDNIMWISGVSYYTPRRWSTGAYAFTLTRADAHVAAATHPWTDGYRVDDNPLTGGANPAQLSSPCPAFLYLGPFSYDTDTGEPDGTPTYTLPASFTDSRGARWQRVEFPFNYLGSNGGGDFSETNAPQSTDDLDISMNGTLVLDGDDANPSFSQGAAPRFFVRRPLVHDDWTEAVQPAYSTPDGSGEELAEEHGYILLFHSTVCSSIGVGTYGNIPLAATPNQCPVWLVTPDKDFNERFLDEIYRYDGAWPGIQVSEGQFQLIGPGMQGWSAGPIPVPVRAGYTAVGNWPDASWTQGNKHSPGSLNILDELQVAGLPPRNPPMNDWVTVPFPSVGICQYPVTTYGGGTYQPPTSQPDYSSCNGDRIYVRAFDVAHSNGSQPVETAVGSNILYLRLSGVELDDLRFTAPGPGGPNGIAVMIKVPGQTTWMDVGRRNGDGPNKQDPILDGAGCQVVGPYTWWWHDIETGTATCQIKVDVGPVATLAKGQGDEVPVLVKVLMHDPSGVSAPGTPLNYDFDHEADESGSATFTGSTGPAISSQRVRGVCGIRILDPSEVLDTTGNPLP